MTTAINSSFASKTLTISSHEANHAPSAFLPHQTCAAEAKMILTAFVGTPIATHFSGISFTTAAPAPTTRQATIQQQGIANVPIARYAPSPTTTPPAMLAPGDTWA